MSEKTLLPRCCYAGCKGVLDLLLSLPVTMVMGTFIGGTSSRGRNLASISSGGPSSSLSTISRFMFEVVKERLKIESIASRSLSLLLPAYYVS